MAGIAIVLASRSGAYVNGAVIPVDGGITVQSRQIPQPILGQRASAPVVVVFARAARSRGRSVNRNVDLSEAVWRRCGNRCANDREPVS